MYVGCCAYALGFGEMGICIVVGLYVGPAESGTMGDMTGVLGPAPAPMPADGSEVRRGTALGETAGELGLAAPGGSDGVPLRDEVGATESN